MEVQAECGQMTLWLFPCMPTVAWLFGKRKVKTHVSVSGSLQIKLNSYSTLPVYTYIYLYMTTADVAVLQEEMRQFPIETTKVIVIFKGQTAI